LGKEHGYVPCHLNLSRWTMTFVNINVNESKLTYQVPAVTGRPTQSARAPRDTIDHTPVFRFSEFDRFDCCSLLKTDRRRRRRWKRVALDYRRQWRRHLQRNLTPCATTHRCVGIFSFGCINRNRIELSESGQMPQISTA